MSHIWPYFENLTPDDFNKIVLAVVALIALVLGPLMQFKIAKRQVVIQEEIAKRQVVMQKEIAERQTETQQQIAKRQIADSISSRRQVWIDELRRDASEYLALLDRIKELKRPAPNLSEEDQKKNFEEDAAATARARELGIRINLRLNPLEEEHNKLVRFLNSLALDADTDPLRNETDEQKRSALNAFGKARSDVVSHLQSILKHEWERVKHGDL